MSRLLKRAYNTEELIEVNSSIAQQLKSKPYYNSAEREKLAILKKFHKEIGELLERNKQREEKEKNAQGGLF